MEGSHSHITIGLESTYYQIIIGRALHRTGQNWIAATSFFSTDMELDNLSRCVEIKDGGCTLVGSYHARVGLVERVRNIASDITTFRFDATS